MAHLVAWTVFVLQNDGGLLSARLAWVFLPTSEAPVENRLLAQSPEGFSFPKGHCHDDFVGHGTDSFLFLHLWGTRPSSGGHDEFLLQRN